MQRRIGEDGIKLLKKRLFMPILDVGRHAARPCRFDHSRTCIHAQDITTKIHQSLRQDAVTAAKIENPLACFGRQQFHQGRAQLRHESGMIGVLPWIPNLPRGHLRLKTKHDSGICRLA